MASEIEALYYVQMEDDSVICQLCPHYCHIQVSTTGRCHARKNIGGVLYTLNYGKVLAFAYDPIEKKPLKNFMPGTMIFSIGTFGCNLDCDFCQNHELVMAHPAFLNVTDYSNIKENTTGTNHNDDGYMDEAWVLTMAEREGSIGIAYTYNEPTIWYEYVYHMCQLTHAKGLKNVLVTNGFINEAPLKALLPYIDAMNIDLKASNESFYERFCGGRLDPVLSTIALAAQHTHVEVTTLVIDTLNSDSTEIEAIAKAIAEIDPNIPLHLSRYFPNHRMTLPPTEAKTLKQAYEVAKRYLKYVYLGNMSLLELMLLEDR